MELLSEAADNASAMDVDNAASPSQRNASQQQPTSILRQRGQPVFDQLQDKLLLGIPVNTRSRQVRNNKSQIRM